MAYKPDKHGRDHCPGGEDPIPCLSTVAILTGWEAETDGEIPPDIWQSVSGYGFFNDGYVSPGAPVNVDLDSGQMTFPTKTLVHIHAYAQFFGDFAAGDVVAVGIQGPGGQGRVINGVTCDAAGVPGAEKISVCAGMWHPTIPLVFELQVFHTHAIDMTLAGCQMTASIEAPLFDTAWQVHA